MKLENVKKMKKRGSLLGAISFFLFFIAVILACLLASAYIYRDHLLLEYVRQQDPKKFGLEVLALDSIITRPIGQVSVELRGLVLKTSKTSPLIRADRVVLATPKNLFDLYRLTLFPSPLSVKAQLVGMKVQALQENDPDAARNSPAPKEKTTASLSMGLPFAIDLETEVQDSEFDFGSEARPYQLKKVTGIIRTTVVPGPAALDVKINGQLAMGLGLKSQHLPLRMDWELEAAPPLNDSMNTSVVLKNLTLSTLGITLKGKGSVRLPDQSFQFEASGTTPDLSIVPLDQAESEALGLRGRLKGHADVTIKAAGTRDGTLTSEGVVTVKNGVLPFALVQETPRRYSINGPVNVDFDVPFKIAYSLAKKNIESLNIQLATLRADLSGAAIRATDFINKAAAVPFTVSTQVTAEGDTIELTQLDLHLFNLVAATKGQISLDPKRTSKVDVAMSLPNLTGWPLLLPVLGTLEGNATKGASDINKANGSLAVKAKIEAPFGAILSGRQKISNDLKVTIDQFDGTDVEFPVNMRQDTEKKIISGLVAGSFSTSGQFETDHEGNVAWNLKRCHGSANFKNLEMQWGDFLNKSPGQDMQVGFSVASKTPTNGLELKVDKLDVRLRDSTLNLSGTVGRTKTGNFALDLTAGLRAALSQLYESAPALRGLRAKVPSGTVTLNTTLVGTYDAKEGLPRSPLTANGRFGLKSPKAFYLNPETKAIPVAAQSTKIEDTENSFAMLKWPIFAGSKMIFDIQIDSVSLKANEAKGLTLLGTLGNGNLKGTLSVANVFGGAMKITSFEMDDLSRKKTAELKLLATGNFQALNLSQVGEFIDPTWKTLIGGIASGTLKLAALPLAKESLVDTATAEGALTVKQGSLSTVSLDQLVNQKLAEYPLIAKLTGAQPKIASKGVNLNLSTIYSYANGRLALKDLKAITPEKNELQFNGWLQKDFTADLTGVAHLANTPIGGSFRQANSDAAGRLVVPIHITGALKSPSLSIAENALREMADKTVQLEGNKIKKNIKDKAVDAIKEELKKRGLGF